jgi:hypothetical protein
MKSTLLEIRNSEGASMRSLAAVIVRGAPISGAKIFRCLLPEMGGKNSHEE